MTVVTETTFIGCCRVTNLFVSGIPYRGSDCVFVTFVTVCACDGWTYCIVGDVGRYGAFVIAVIYKTVDVAGCTVVDCCDVESKVLVLSNT